MMTVYARVPVQLLLAVAWTVKLKVPAAVGVPERTPPVVRVSPVGSVPLKP